MRKKSPNTGKCGEIQIRKNTSCGHFSRNATHQIFERSIFVRTHVTVAVSVTAAMVATVRGEMTLP